MEVEILETDRDGAGGNTESPARQGVQRRFWCFTYNNFDSVEILETTLRSLSDWYLFQEEVGENGTPHLQGTVCFKARCRLSELKPINPKIHWAPTKCVKSSILYCQKKETAVGRVWSHGIEVQEELDLDEPYGWAMEVLNAIDNKPDKRTINWYWEPDGNVGKTSLCKYLVAKRGALMLTGKSNDMYYMLSKYPNRRRVILIDVPRSGQDYINYGAIEQIKNGLCFSGKYDSDQLIFNCPHVFVFANEPPKVCEMSVDRWNIVRIKSGGGDAC